MFSRNDRESPSSQRPFGRELIEINVIPARNLRTLVRTYILSIYLYTYVHTYIRMYLYTCIYMHRYTYMYTLERRIGAYLRRPQSHAEMGYYYVVLDTISTLDSIKWIFGYPVNCDSQNDYVEWDDVGERRWPGWWGEGRGGEESRGCTMEEEMRGWKGDRELEILSRT